MSMSVEAIENEVMNLGKNIADMRDNHIHTIYKEIKLLNMALMNRLPIWATMMFGVMSATIVGLITYGVMRG